jgi:T5SS/PEP-CTERM-associated repeat protein
VGYEGSGNRLVISNQAGVVGGHGEVGHYGSNNSVLVTGTGAAWNNNNNLYLGVYGMGNTLLISNAGRVYNNHGLVGFYSNSINNSAIVSGLGTVWSNRFVLHVGESGASNTLVITDRGAVFDSEGIVGYSNGSSNNSVIVTRAAVWSNTNLFVGGYGAGNRLVITNQSRVLDDEGIMGYAIESDNNSVLVTGFNSSWSNRADLFIGRYGSGNTMIISNQAKVYDNFGVMGYYSDSSNNSAIVSGPGSVWSNAASMYCGLSGAGNTLIITNGGAIGMGDPGAGAYIGRNSSSSNNTVLVTGPGSVWTNPGGLHVGYDGSGNGLLISNQGKVFDNQGEMGRGSSNNFVIVTGLGSVWSNSLTMVFASGSGNSLLISNGGAVFSYDAAVGGPGNSALVTGPGSVWNNSFNLTIGDYGSGNRLVIRDQGKVFDFNGAVSGRDTSVLVTGAGSVWSNSYLRVGGDLVISNQGAVFSDYGDVGLGGSNVSVRVVDNGLWQNKSTLSVGVGSSGNDLTIAGGTVLASNAFISFVDDTHEGGTNNLIRVDGGNLVVTNRAGTGTLVVSSGEGSGSLIINGGSVTAERLVLTNGNNSIIVFNGGTLHNKGTTVTNNQSFVVGDGISSATFHLLGGLHSFNDGLILRSNSFLTGCGTINGNVVIDPGSAVRADCSTLLFTDSVTNNGTMVADGAVLESSGMLVNNGKIFLLHGGTTNFHGTFINNGVILNGDIHLAIERDGSGGYFLRYTAAPAVRYRLQRAASVTGPWSDLATNTAPASGLVEFHETSPPPGQAFYRTVQP